MINAFLKSLIRELLSYPDQRIILREVFEFNDWVNHDLRKTAFLPANKPKDIAWRFKELLKSIKRMPALSSSVFKYLNDYDGYAKHPTITQEEAFLIDSKKDRLEAFIQWIQKLEPNQVHTLQQTLLDQPEPVNFKRRRNRKRAPSNNLTQ